MTEISPWLKTYWTLFPGEGHVLDLACGGGRHSRFLSEKGFAVSAVDIDIEVVVSLKLSNVNVVAADLEQQAWPFLEDAFDGILVTNYLWRPLFPNLKKSLKKDGVLIYETFAVGNEQYGRPRNPDFLLKNDELKEEFSEFDILAFEEGYREYPSPSVRQAVVARK